MASKPPGVADLEWSRLRIAVSRSVGLDPELLDPLQSIDALHRSLAFLGLSAVDVEHIIDDCFEPEDVEAVVSAVRAGKPATFGALMSILAR